MNNHILRPQGPRLAWAACLCVLLGGCSRPASSDQPGRPDLGASEPVTLQLLDPAALDDLLRQHRGNVVLIDFWATWCLECVDLFPHTVELHERLADQGLTVISISLDEPEVRESILAFLHGQGATFDNYISQYGSGSESFDGFVINGGLPHFKLYDRSGKLRKVFPDDEPLNMDGFDRAVEELLAEL